MSKFKVKDRVQSEDGRSGVVDKISFDPNERLLYTVVFLDKTQENFYGDKLTARGFASGDVVYGLNGLAQKIKGVVALVHADNKYTVLWDYGQNTSSGKWQTLSLPSLFPE